MSKLPWVLSILLILLAGGLGIVFLILTGSLAVLIAGLLLSVGVSVCLISLWRPRSQPHLASSHFPQLSPVITDPAQLLHQRYQVVQQLSSTQFGQTYIADDTQARRGSRCLVKYFAPQTEALGSWEIAKRLFKGEAEVLERLSGLEQVPHFYEYIEADEILLVREYIEGQSLEEELQPNRPVPESQVIGLLASLLQGLARLHQHQVIHRDIKPSNVIRRQSDFQLVLIDFGAVKATQPNSEVATMSTVSIGTMGYAAYEQIRGKPVFASDLYSAGILAIQALTGLKPARIPMDLQANHYLWRPHAKTSPLFAAVLDKLIQDDVSERYQSAEDVLADLKPLLGS